MFQVFDQDGFKDLKYYGKTVQPNNLVYNLSGPILDRPTRTSIQISPAKHIEDEWGQYVNHSCNPSVRVDGNKLIAVKRINPGDSITFDYNETEDLMSNPFICHCCDKLVAGKSARTNNQ